jgi:hypothetical protein
LRSAGTAFSEAEVTALKLQAAPMGLSGVTLPLALFLVIRANISRSVQAGMEFASTVFGKGKNHDASVAVAVVRHE